MHIPIKHFQGSDCVGEKLVKQSSQVVEMVHLPLLPNSFAFNLLTLLSSDLGQTLKNVINRFLLRLIYSQC